MDHQHQAEVCAGTHQSDYTFKEEAVPGLAEALAEVAHKWEEIAVALRLSEAVRAECREGSSLTMKLYRVLHQWVVGQHSNAAQATRENLKTALASPLVEQFQLARELDDKLKTSSSLHTRATSQEKSIFQSRVREVLMERYSLCPEVPPGSWPPVVSKRFVNLALIETCDQPLKSDYSIRGDTDDVLAKKTPVKYEEVFKEYKRQKKLLILGRPGSGKTTLVHKLVRDWSAGKALQGAELVFLVSLRMLNSKKCDLQQLLSKYFRNDDHVKQVFDAMDQTRGERVCFIFDGFDEYCPPDKEESVIFSLLDKSFLVDAMIIVTSRPAAAQVLNNSFNRLEVFGFSKSQIREYIKNFPFSSLSSVNEAHSQKLQSFLAFHPGVSDLCYLPVNCAIICFMYDTGSNDLPDTQTKIYNLLTRLIIMRQLTSRDKYRQLDSLEGLEGQEAEDFKKMCNLAFDMTTQSQQVITRGPASSEESHSLGLVTTDITAELSGYKNSYSFLHLTLQEFLAAYHISKLNQEEQISLIKKYGKTVHMLTVWRFYFGLVDFKEGPDRAEKLLNSVNSDNVKGNFDLIRVQYLYEAQQDCINQFVSSRKFVFNDILSNYDLSALAYVVSSAASASSPARPTDTQQSFSLGGRFRALIDQFSALIPDSASSPARPTDTLQSFSLGGRFRALIDQFSALITGSASSQARPTDTLQFFSWGPESGKLGVLIDKLSDTALDFIVSLGLSYYPHFSITDMELLAHMLKVNRTRHTEVKRLKCLKHLALHGCCIGDEGIAVLATGLDGNHVLESLNLSYNSISVTGVSELMKADCHLKNLNLSANNIHDEGVAVLAIGLDGNHVLESLDLSHNSISATTGISELMKADWHLKDLNLAANKICDEGAKAVAKGLGGSHSLKSIKLSGNKIGAAGVEALALVLQGNIYLNLAGNKFTSDTTTSQDTVTSDYCSNFLKTTDSTTEEVQGKGILHNHNLEKLDLSYNVCDEHPVTITSKFKSLSHLDLSHNKLGLPGAKAVMDYAANHDNCRQLKYLGLNSIMREDIIPCFSSTANVKDLKQLLSSSSGFIVDLSWNDIDKTIALSILKRLNHHDRIRGFYLENIDHVADLIEAFRHDYINRILVFNSDNQNFTHEVPARTKPPTPT